MVTKGRSHWFASLPATFMTAVVATYILIAPEGFHISQNIAYPIGVISAIVAMFAFLFVAKKKFNKEVVDTEDTKA
jgi:ABC-type transport system involved in cytochrome c biogenesis permease subunit